MEQFVNDATLKALMAWVHNEYGRKAGLQPDDYAIVFNVTADYDVEIKAGATITIITRFPPWHSRFKQTMKSVFENPNIKGFKRGKSLIRHSDAVRWYGLSERNMNVPQPKKSTLSDVQVSYITKLRLLDKKSRREVVVEIEGSAFDAYNKALKLLFGEKLG